MILWLAKKLGITPKIVPEKKPPRKPSDRAKKVNERWHMDVSVLKTADNVTFYIYSVMDNLSRKLVDLSYSTVLSAKLRTESLRRAVHNEFDVDLDNQKLELIVDGGSENNNSTVYDFIDNSFLAIDMKIALKDVRYSNSMVEAVFKIMKQYYFKYKPILAKDIEKHLAFFWDDYNNHRPHHAHKIYTPSEISNDQSLLDSKPILKKGNQERLDANRNFCCKFALKS